ncbi:MAG: hypothetical protein Kow00111_02780 [Thermincola ferriacetica]
MYIFGHRPGDNKVKSTKAAKRFRLKYEKQRGWVWYADLMEGGHQLRAGACAGKDVYSNGR